MLTRKGVTTAQVSAIVIIVAIVAAGGTAAYFVGQPAKVQTVTEVQTQVQTQVKEVTKTEVKTLRKVQFQIGWLNEYPNRIGWWVGLDKGFFREEGIDLEIISGKGGAFSVQQLVSGNVPIAETGITTVLSAIDKGQDIVAVWMYLQRDPAGYAFKEGSQLKSASDFVGKRIGVSIPSYHYVTHQLIMKKLGVEKQIEEIPIGFDPCSPIANNQADITVAFVDDAIICRHKGVKVNHVLHSDFGVGGYGLAVWVKRETLQKDPELVGAFVRATIKSMEYTIKNTDEAVNIFLKFFPTVDRNQARDVLLSVIPLMQTADTKQYGLGWMKAEGFQTWIDALTGAGRLEKRLDASKIFTDQFIESYYQTKK